MDSQNHIQEAIKILKQGGTVIFPTDTAFGIGCIADNEEAVKKVFSIRKRPPTQAVPLLVSSIKMAKEYASIPENIENDIIRQYWPGALTICLAAKREKVGSLIRGGGATVGLRMPAHSSIHAMIATVGVPVLGPSANFHGEKTPYELADINPGLYHLVDYIVPGVCAVKKESTVIDCTVDPWKILRQGAVSVQV